MPLSLRRLTLKGFRSIDSLESLALNSINVLVGANGAGKSNFVAFFHFMRALVDRQLQQHVGEQGGGEALFFLGEGEAGRIDVSLELDGLVYEALLQAREGGGIELARECVESRGAPGHAVLAHAADESGLKSLYEARKKADRAMHPAAAVYEALSTWTVYHFHDTTALARMRRDQPIAGGDRLNEDGSNVAAFLLYLRTQHAAHYSLVRDAVRLVAPFFDDFHLASDPRSGLDCVRLRWLQKGVARPFQPSHLSDGTIRFICLAAALQQPTLPSTLVIDEPELGLHPFSLALLADLIKSAAGETQVIISTQSPILLDHFEPDDVIVVNRVRGRSMFERLSSRGLRAWLNDYTVGELWQKNVLDGGPAYE